MIEQTFQFSVTTVIDRRENMVPEENRDGKTSRPA